MDEQSSSKRISIVSSHVLGQNPTHGADNYHYHESPTAPATPTTKQLDTHHYIELPHDTPKHKYLGWITVPDGEAVAVWNSFGRVSIYKGPETLFLINEQYAYVKRYTATGNEYLRVLHRDGQTEHIPGPTTLFFDPRVHKKISIEPGVNVPDGYAIVVFEKNDGKFTRTIVKGPTLHILKSNQALHTFYWGIPDQRLPVIRNRRILKFNKLRIMPDQIYIDLEDVRTSDDALLTVKIMLFYRLVNIDKMLETTHDPVGEMMNNLAADLIAFANARTFETFKQDTDTLNSLQGYPQLIERSQNMGYEITKVVYRGYQASVKLQEMHNNAIEARTLLKLKAENESQQQDLEDMKQERNQERQKREMQLSEETSKHKLEMAEMDEEFKLKRERIQHEESMKRKEIEQEWNTKNRVQEMKLEQENKQKMKEIEVEYYKGLKEKVGVDVSGYLKSQYKQADKIVKIMTPKL